MSLTSSWDKILYPPGNISNSASILSLTSTRDKTLYCQRQYFDELFSSALDFFQEQDFTYRQGNISNSASIQSLTSSRDKILYCQGHISNSGTRFYTDYVLFQKSASLLSLTSSRDKILYRLGHISNSTSFPQ